MVISSISKNGFVAGVFDRSGSKINSTSTEDQYKISSYLDNYCKEGYKPKSGVGVWRVVAGFEAVVGLFLGFLQKSPATITNLATSVAEFAQTMIIGSKLPKSLRENAIAGVVTGAGSLGLYSWFKDLKETIKGDGKELESLPMWQKVGLTVGSLASSLMMSLGFLEKSSISPLIQEKNGGEGSEEIELNGNSDGRCTIEWGLMAIFLWFSKIKPIKMAIDLTLPLSALYDGVGHFLEHAWKHKDIEKNIRRTLGDALTNATIKLFQLNKEEKIQPWLFKSWWFGKKEGEGLRTKLLPIFRLFGANPPICHLNKDNQLVVKVPSPKIETDKTQTDIEDRAKTNEPSPPASFFSRNFV